MPTLGSGDQARARSGRGSLRHLVRPAV